MVTSRMCILKASANLGVLGKPKVVRVISNSIVAIAGQQSFLFIDHEKLKIVLPSEKSFSLYTEGTW